MIDYLWMNILKYLCLKERFDLRFTSKQFYRLVERLKDDFNESVERESIVKGNKNLYFINHAIFNSYLKYLSFYFNILDEIRISYTIDDEVF